MLPVIFLIVFFINIDTCVDSAKILMVFPMPSYSHYLIPYRLGSKLIERGHHITCINPYPQKAKQKNFEDIDVSENIALSEDFKQQLLAMNDYSFIQESLALFDLAGFIVNQTIRHQKVQTLLKSNEKFDLVIMENFLSEALIGFGHRFNAPVIAVSAVASNTLNNYMFGNLDSMAYIPQIMSKSAANMNFWERIENVITTSLLQLIIVFYHLPQQRKIFSSFVTDVNLDHVLYNTTLMFTNSHPSISPAKPLVPNIIEIGGLHPSPKPLPNDLKKYLDESKDGVILFSMGSNLKSEDLEPEVRQGILRALSKLKQNVLWKFETNLPDTPKNVKIMKWLPQQDILNHPNVKALITHGGRLSTVEAIFYGIPVIGIPVFGDQLGNIAQAVIDGYAVKVQLNELSEKTLSAALDEILNNPKYTNNAKLRSQIMNDQPLKPLDNAVFWVEYVIRHRGAPFLKTAGLDLNWWQREMIDIFLFFVVVLGLFIFLLLKIFKAVCKRKKCAIPKPTNLKKRQ